ncbi:hypothetical protein OG410_23370 [Streptomyces sp. NBC_00659]|uniref:hypothetical protein n=1 Tax=Streptomyces sp. NBC_00659 TaxID=2903669 RepID=UPI002E2F945B|nr:hypothetical protein [Streptomyces sp. NBC_00659]
MPRGRHRHSPPLHRVLPSSAIAGVSLVCAIGPWLFTDAFALRVLAAGAAATAVVSAVVLRQWDSAAGKRVADLTRARASDEWRYEERVAELETDLEESRELRAKLEQKLRAKRTELAGLRNEHAALLRRYATAETERATALEGRRQLAIEASVPARALPAARTAPDEVETEDLSGTPEAHDTDSTDSSGAPDAPETGETGETSGGPDASEGPAKSEASGETAQPEGPRDGVSASVSGSDAIEAFMAPDEDTVAPDAEDDEDARAEAGTGTDESSEVFSPAGSSLFLRAGAALSRSAGDGREAEGAEARTASTSVALALPDADPGTDSVQVPDARSSTARSLNDVPAPGGSALDAAVRRDTAAKQRAAMRKGAAATKELVATRDPAAERDAVTHGEAAPHRAPATETGPSADSVAEAGGAQGKPEAAREHQRAAAEAESPTAVAPETSRRAVTAPPARAALPPAKSAQRSGHFTVPTAVAVVPHTAPVRRPSVEGGFDFFGTQAEQSDAAAMEAVQNEDLADVVGQEALAVHQAESGSKPAGEATDGADRQVIDLTEHDETEHIDMTGLRSAAS